MIDTEPIYKEYEFSDGLQYEISVCLDANDKSTDIETIKTNILQQFTTASFQLETQTDNGDIYLTFLVVSNNYLRATVNQ